MNIQHLIDSGSTNITLAVSPAELQEFARQVISDYQAEIGAKHQTEDVALSVSSAAKALGVSINTLWRWEKSGYLQPHHRVGKRPVYMQSQIENMKGGTGL